MNEMTVATLRLPDEIRTQLSAVQLKMKRDGVKITVAQLAVQAIGVALAAFEGEGQVLDTSPIDEDACTGVQVRWPKDTKEKLVQVMQAYSFNSQRRAATALIQWWCENQN